MGHPGRVLDQALDGAERLGEGEEPRPPAHLQGGGLPASQGEAHDPSVPPHLTLGHLVTGVPGQRGVQHGAHRLVGAQQVHDRQGTRAMALHPERQRLETALDQVAIQRPGHGPDGVLQKRQPRGEAAVVGRGKAAHHVRVPAQVLGRRMDDDVGAEAKRLLQPRRGEGVVDHEQGTGSMGRLGDRRDVDDAEQRIGRCLDPDHPRGRCQRLLEVGGAPEVGRVDGETGGLVDPGGQSMGAAVRVGGEDEVVTRPEQPQHGVLGRRPAGEGEAVGSALEQGEVRFQTGPGRVARARVLEASVLSDRVLLEGGGEVDRRGHRPRLWIGPATPVDGAGLETEPAQVQCVGHGRLSEGARPAR